MSQLTVSRSSWTKLNFDSFFLVTKWLQPEEVAKTQGVCKAWQKHSDKELVWQYQCAMKEFTPIREQSKLGEEIVQELQNSPGSSNLSVGACKLIVEYSCSLFKRAFSHPLEVFPPNIVSVFGKADWEKIKAEKPHAINWENIQLKEPPMPSNPIGGGWKHVRATKDLGLHYHRFLYPHGITPLQFGELFGILGRINEEYEEGDRCLELDRDPNPDPTQWCDISIAIHPGSLGKVAYQQKKLLETLHSPIPKPGQGLYGLCTYHEKTGIWFLGQAPRRYMLVKEQNSTFDMYLGNSNADGPCIYDDSDNDDSDDDTQSGCGVVVFREYSLRQRPLAVPAKASQGCIVS